MAESIKEELNIEEFEIKEHIASSRKKSSSTVENTCTVNQYIDGNYRNIS